MLRPSSVAATLFFGASAALAGTVQDCGHPIPERSIEGCSLLIGSAGIAGSELGNAYELRGAAHIVMGDLDLAIADLDAAIRVNPSSPEAFTTRADAYLQKAGVAEYLREADEQRDVSSTRPEPELARRDFYERATADYDRALALYPGHFPAYFGRALAHRALGRGDRARNDQLAAQFPTHRYYNRSQSAYVMRQLALVIDPAGFRTGAIDRLRPLDEAIRLNPSDPKAYLDRAWAFVNFGQSARALADYDAAIRLHPNHAEAYLRRGEELLAKRNLPPALADFEALVRLEPNHFRGFDLRGRVYERLGERDRALADYRRALSLESRAANAKAGIERLSVPVRE